jgi:hypothetical protein
MAFRDLRAGQEKKSLEFKVGIKPNRIFTTAGVAGITTASDYHLLSL